MLRRWQDTPCSVADSSLNRRSTLGKASWGLRGSPPRSSLVFPASIYPIHNFQTMTQRRRASDSVQHPSIPNSILLIFFLAICPVGALVSVPARALEVQAPSDASIVPGVYNPVANPKAVVTHGNARFTVLTPQLIRMEWAANGKFEDHASLVFLNRRLSVPKFTVVEPAVGRDSQLVITTSALQLCYKPNVNEHGKFTADNLEVAFALNGKRLTWHPGTPDTGNLMGTTRTLDGALGDKTKEPIAPGLLSRDGWTLVAGTGGLHPGCRPHPAAAALRLWRVVITLLGL